MGLISDLFSSNSYDASAAKAKQAQTSAANTKADKQLAAYKSAVGEQREALADPLTKINDIYEQEQLGRIAYMNALGLQGPENSEAARAMFQASPGYQYQLEQGEQSGLRNNAFTGALRSGQTSTDLNAYAQNLANQDWGNWLNRLQMFNPMAANAQNTGLATTLAGIEGTYGANRAGVYGSKYDTIGAANAAYQNALAQNRAGAAGNVFDLFKMGTNLAGQLGGAYVGGGGLGGLGWAPGTGPNAYTAGQGPGMSMLPDGTWTG